MSDEMWIAKIESDGKSIVDVPREHLTDRVCFAAVTSGSVRYVPRITWNVPRSLLTTEMCMAAVRLNGNALEHVPVELMSEDMCMEAVKSEGMALWHVPDAYRTRRVCLAACESDWRCYWHVPVEYRTEEMFESFQCESPTTRRVDRLKQLVKTPVTLDATETDLVCG